MSKCRSGKIISDHQELLRRVNQLRAEGKTIVYANGCFDLFHVGHVRFFEGASKEGDVLIVALNSDESARALKGPGRPVMPLSERQEIIAAIECVDFVTSFSGKACAELLDLLKPDVHAKGTDWSAGTIPERDTVAAFGGRIAIVGDPKDHSSTDLLTTIRQSTFKDDHD